MYSDCLKGIKMANSNLEVKVTCRLNIDTESADFALKAVNIYCNKNGYRWSLYHYTKSGKEKIAYFCPTCGRKLQ